MTDNPDRDRRDRYLHAMGIESWHSRIPGPEPSPEPAGRVFTETVAPIGIVCDISQSDFAAVYVGEGRNAADTPVGDIFGRADHLALFVVTLGEHTCREIGLRFESNDFAVIVTILQR